MAQGHAWHCTRSRTKNQEARGPARRACARTPGQGHSHAASMPSPQMNKGPRRSPCQQLFCFEVSYNPRRLLGGQCELFVVSIYFDLVLTSSLTSCLTTLSPPVETRSGPSEAHCPCKVLLVDLGGIEPPSRRPSRRRFTTIIGNLAAPNAADSTPPAGSGKAVCVRLYKDPTR